MPAIAKGPAAPAKGPAKPVQVKAHVRAAPAATPQPQAPALDPATLKAAQALANVQVNPSINDLQQQIAANNRQTQGTVKLTGGYYGQLEPYVQQGVTQSGQIASGLNSQLQGISGDTQSQLAGLGQNALSSLLKYAPQGEGGLANAATSDLAAQIARQQGLAAQQAGTYRGFGANQGANYQQMANSQLGTFGLQGQEALRGIAQAGTVKNEPLTAKIAGLQAQKGALVTTDYGKLQQQNTANQIAQAGLGIKQQTANTAAQYDKNKIALGVTNANNAAEKLRITQQNDLANQALHAAQLNEKSRNDAANQALKQAALNLKASSTRGGAGAKPLTPYQNNEMYKLLGQAEQLVQDGQGKKLSEQQIRANLQDGANPAKRAFDPVLIQAAYELLGWGHITPQTARAMRAMGMRGGTFRGAPIRVAPVAKQSNPLMTGGSSGLSASNNGLG